MNQLNIRNADGLYWIGRYLQRFTILSKESIKAFDCIIDTHYEEGKVLFEKLGYPIEYINANDFFQQAVKQMPQGSLFSYIAAARENAVSLRDIIDDDLFASINIAYMNLQTHANPSVKFLETIIKEMYSFWGVIALKTIKEKAYALMEFGQIVETIDLKLRLFGDISMVLFDIDRLNQNGKLVCPEFKPIIVHYSNVERLIETINSAIVQIIHYEN